MGQIELYTYNGKIIKPKTDAITFNTMITQSGILHGCSITYVGTNQIKIGYGEGIIKGRRFYIEEQTMAVELSDSGEKSGRIYIRMDLSNAEKPIDILSITAASLPDLEKDEEVNYTSGIYEIELATYTASETMLSDVTATYITVNGADILDTMEEIMANTDPNKCAGALAVKELGSSLTLDFSNASPDVQDVKTLLQKTLEKLFPSKIILLDENTNLMRSVPTPSSTVTISHSNSITITVSNGGNFAITAQKLITPTEENHNLVFEFAQNTVASIGYVGVMKTLADGKSLLNIDESYVVKSQYGKDFPNKISLDLSEYINIPICPCLNDRVGSASGNIIISKIYIE